MILALSIFLVIVPDILAYFEEKNREKRLEAYKWRLNTLQIMKRLTADQTQELRGEILAAQKVADNKSIPPIVSGPEQPPTGVHVDDHKPLHSQELSKGETTKPDVIVEIENPANPATGHSQALPLSAAPKSLSTDASKELKATGGDTTATENTLGATVSMPPAPAAPPQHLQFVQGQGTGPSAPSSAPQPNH